MKFPTSEKRNLNFVIGLIIVKVNIERLKWGNRKVHQKLFHNHYCLEGYSGIENWDFVFFE